MKIKVCDVMKPFENDNPSLRRNSKKEVFKNKFSFLNKVRDLFICFVRVRKSFAGNIFSSCFYFRSFQYYTVHYCIDFWT